MPLQFRNEAGDFICPMCGVKIDPDAFKDRLSVREFRISGLCQGCQDEIFHSDDDDA